MSSLIYSALYGFEEIDPKILPFIYESFLELNNKSAHYSFTMESPTYKEGDNFVKCEFEFEGSNDALVIYKGSVEYPSNSILNFGKRLEYINVNVPLDFTLTHRNIETVAPSYIKCKTLFIESCEMTLFGQTDEEDFMFECEDIVVNQRYEQYLQLSGPGKANKSICIVCPQQPQYPLCDYWTSVEIKLKELTSEETALYKKLRSIILDFRSHSKHELAKLREKIDFVFGNNTTGKKVINALIETKIMYASNHLYKLDSDVMAAKLGLSYDDIRNYEKSEQVVTFLRNIK